MKNNLREMAISQNTSTAVTMARGAKIPTMGATSSGETSRSLKKPMTSGFSRTFLPIKKPRITAMGTQMKRIIKPRWTILFPGSGSNSPPSS